MTERITLVVGATGIIGREVVATFGTTGRRVVALSRRGDAPSGASQAIAADLLDARATQEALSGPSGVNEIVFAAYAPQGGWIEEVAPNLALLTNAVEAVEAAGAPLERVVLITGAKYYGVHLGVSPSPAREDEPRHIGPNFYYAQEDYLASRSDARWTWTHLIPTHLTGFALGNPMNLALSIAVYASIVRELGLRLDFPGTEGAFHAMTQIVDSRQVAGAALWALQTEAAAGQRFNISNGDPTRWSLLWPRIARCFGVPEGGPRPVPLADFMAEQEKVWQRLRARHGLVGPEWQMLVSWRFLEFMFSIDYDVVLELGKVRRAGYVSHPDTWDMFHGRITEYRSQRIIPSYD